MTKKELSDLGFSEFCRVKALEKMQARRRFLLCRIVPIAATIVLSVGGGVVTWNTYDRPITQFLVGVGKLIFQKQRVPENDDSKAHKIRDTALMTMKIATFIVVLGLYLDARKSMKSSSDSEDSTSKVHFAFMLTLTLLLLNAGAKNLAYKIVPQASDFVRVEQPTRSN